MSAEAAEYIPGGVQHNLAFNLPFPLVITKASGCAPLRPRRQPVPRLPAGRRAHRARLEPAGGPRAGHRAAARLRAVHGPVPRVRAEAGPLHRRAHARGADVPDARVRHRGLHGRDPGRPPGHRPEERRQDGRGLPRLVRPARLRAAHPRQPAPGGARRAPLRLPAHPGVLPRRPRQPWSGRCASTGLAAAPRPSSSSRSARRAAPGRWRVDFNAGVRELCDRYGALLVFDEVVTGFRIGLSGAQGYFGVEPDLTVFGKVVAGGYPAAGGLGGKREVMKLPGSRHRGGREEGPRRRHAGGQSAVQRGRLLHADRDREAERVRARGCPGRPAHRGAAGIDPALRPAVRRLQPGLDRASADGGHHALPRRPDPVLGDPGPDEGAARAQARHGGDGRGLHGRRASSPSRAPACTPARRTPRRPSTRPSLPSTGCCPRWRARGSSRPQPSRHDRVRSASRPSSRVAAACSPRGWSPGPGATSACGWTTVRIAITPSGIPYRRPDRGDDRPDGPGDR